MRIIADHVRGSVQLIADGVVPSNERRGYVLRRIMRRAIYQGRVLGLEPPYLGRFAECAIELLAPANPALSAEREAIMRWINDEEESFGHTLDRGSQLLDRLLSEAGAASTSWISAEDAFELHDTYGFPYDLTRELVAERGLGVDDEGFEALMDEQRERARSGGVGGGDGDHDAVLGFVGSAPGEPLRRLRGSPHRAPASSRRRRSRGTRSWSSSRRARSTPRAAARSPTRARCAGRAARRRWSTSTGSAPTRRCGSAAPHLSRARGSRRPSRHFERHATMRNHTATHLLHAALREQLGTHVRQAGSAVRPDKLRFDFTHGARLSPDELNAIGSRVNEWIKGSAPVRAIEMDRAEAERLGAMALFGEKYGDWVRVVEVAGVSRELCGGTHVANTAEIGLFEIVSEGSSASNVRRIEAITGPAAIDLFRERTDQLVRAGAALGGGDDPAAAAERMATRLRELEAAAAERDAEAAGNRAAELSDSAEVIGGVSVVVGELGEVGDARALLSAAHEIKARLGDAAVVLAGTSGEKVSLVGVFSAAAVERGLSAADVIRLAAAIVGGGGGGKPEVAQAGGRDVERIGEALQTARTAVENGLR